MNLAAVEHFAFDNFCYPLNDDELEINIKTGKDVEKLFIASGDPFAAGIMGGNWQWKGSETQITERKELQFHYYWTVRIKPEFKRLSYYFRLTGSGEEYFFTHNGFFTPEEFEQHGRKSGLFIYPWMNPADIARTPAWVRDAVWYQIFPARFCRGKSSIVPEKLEPWPNFGEKIRNGHPEPVYGGNLQGIIDKLDYLKDLGITGIYTTTLNKSTSQHKYNTDDYEQIDPEFGDDQTMKTFVQEAHRRGIRIMLDGVFNHSGWFFSKWQDVWEKREKSEYKDWFMINDFNFTNPGYGFGKGNSGKGKYFAFAFVDGMPKLNTNNPVVRNYILDVCEKWVREYDIDAIRLDVANEISHVFCKELKKRMTSLKPDFYIIGEIWHNSLPWLRGDEFDSVMNYPLQQAIADFCCEDIMTAKQFEYAVNRCYAMYFRQTNEVLFNQMDSHDTIRILNRCNGDKVRAKKSLVLLFAMAGSVCIYYGTEILLAGGYDPDNRRCMPWKEIEEGCFAEEMDFVKKLIQLRKNHPALLSTIYDFEQAGDDRTVRLVKTAEDGSEKICVVINGADESVPEDKVLLKDDGMLIFAM